CLCRDILVFWTRVNRIINPTVTIYWAILAGSVPATDSEESRASLRLVLPDSWPITNYRDGGRHPRADGVLRLPDRARDRSANGAAVHRPVCRGLVGDR